MAEDVLFHLFFKDFIIIYLSLIINILTHISLNLNKYVYNTFPIGF